MLNTIHKHHPNYELATKFFKEFKKESLVWTAYSWANEKRESKIEFVNLLNERHSFEAIAAYLESEFKNSTPEEIKKFLEECYKYKINYIPNEDLKFLENNNRLCWIIINDFKIKYKDLIHRRYNFRNGYFSLLYLIHIDLINHHLKVDDLRHYLKILKKEDNPVLFLSKYIDNPEFIDWALKYTERKNHIFTFPNFTPTDTNEQLEKFLGYWDFLYIDDLQKYCIEINKLKKSWQQNIFREKNKENPKKHFHLPLKKKTKTRLEKLANFKKISESDLLEKLINKAYEEDMCDEKGKDLY